MLNAINNFQTQLPHLHCTFEADKRILQSLRPQGCHCLSVDYIILLVPQPHRYLSLHCYRLMEVSIQLLYLWRPIYRLSSKQNLALVPQPHHHQLGVSGTNLQGVNQVFHQEEPDHDLQGPVDVHHGGVHVVMESF